MTMDVDYIKRTKNLLAICEGDAPMKRVAATGGGEWAGPCPFCGGRDRFHVQPNLYSGGRWFCRTCTNGKWQDVIAYVMKRDNCGFLEACSHLASNLKRPRQFTPVLRVPKVKESSSSTWQSFGRQVIEQGQIHLWGTAGKGARKWLNHRGLADETLKKWQIGYLPGDYGQWRSIGKLNVPCGILIPCVVDDVIWYLKVRRAAGKAKYAQVAGGRPALFGAQTLQRHPVAVICEGEFDAMLLEQIAGDLVGVVTLGSATARLDVPSWASFLLPVSQYFVAFDSDEAGRMGAESMLNLTRRAKPISLPAGVKDITDAWKAGVDLREWVNEALNGASCNVQLS